MSCANINCRIRLSSVAWQTSTSPFGLRNLFQKWINQNYAQEVFQLTAMWVLCSGRDREDREGVKEKQTADVIQAGGPSHPSPSRWLIASHCVCLTLCLCSHANCSSETLCITWKKCSCDRTAEAVDVCILYWPKSYRNKRGPLNCKSVRPIRCIFSVISGRVRLHCCIAPCISMSEGDVELYRKSDILAALLDLTKVKWLHACQAALLLLK